MSITREQIRELAEFEASTSAAVSFYFQPSTPRNKAHKEDAILVKDLARDAMKSLENHGSETHGSETHGPTKDVRESVRADLDRILQLPADLRSNGTHAKAVFACAAQNLWREYELPPMLAGTQLFLDRHFHLKPIAHLLGGFPRLGIVLVDRHRARIFDLRLGELTEREDFFQPLSRRGRSDGYGGYDGGHAERRVEDEVRQHFKRIASLLKDSLEKGVFEKWILGCQDIQRSQLEPQLHPYVSQALLGHFHADTANATRDEIRSHAQHILDCWQNDRKREVVAQVLSQARSHGRGVTGLRRVLRALEMGEVQTLLIGEQFQSHAVECTGCGHLDAHIVDFCPVCARRTHEIVDVGEAILPRVILHDIETVYVKDDPEFDIVGNIAALLRFRAEATHPFVPTFSDETAKRQPQDFPRLRRFAS